MGDRPRVLVTGAGGFIGHHLVTRLVEEGAWVRGVDLHRPHYQASAAQEFLVLDLRRREDAQRATKGIEQVYALAADMGGMGYLATHDAPIFRNNMSIDMNTVEAAVEAGVQRLFYASSACVYPEDLQTGTDAAPLREAHAYPAAPPDGYGWEKLFSERLCEYAQRGDGLETRVARFHNIFGPLGAWEGGREKAPAALCRKVAQAKLTGEQEVEVWGDGAQTRSFCYIDDCLDGVLRLMASDHSQPLNIGQDHLISINDLLSLVAEVAGTEVTPAHIAGPQGVRGRCSDNAQCQEVLGWVPTISLKEGLRRTYPWIEAQVEASLAVGN